MEDAARDRLIEEVRAAKQSGAGEFELAKSLAPLDEAYWHEVDRAVEDAERRDPDRLVFDKDARLLIDFGILDWRLIEGEKANRPDLLRELYADSAGNHFYFSEWFAHRDRTFLLMSRVETEESPSEREDLYRDLRPFFQNLPGFSPEAADLFVSGRLDRALGDVARRLAAGEEPRLADQHRQLLAIRSRLIQRARERAGEGEHLELFDRLVRHDQESSGQRPPPGTQPLPRLSRKRRREFLHGEVKLLRSLLRLGIAGSGLTRTHSVLLSNEPRVTKSILASVFRLVAEADGELPAAPAIAIAPYVGTGFYEWDRDTIFVPVRATRSGADAVVTALANFRLMIDALQGGGSMRDKHREHFGADDYRGLFIQDYRDWVLGVAKGFRGALSPKAYAFFRAEIGPRAEHLFAPRELTPRSPAEGRKIIQDSRAKVNRGEAGPHDRYRLAVAYYLDNRRSEAFQELGEAVRLRPIEGRFLLAHAWLAALLGATEQARRDFEEVKEICPATLWAVYAADELQRL